MIEGLAPIEIDFLIGISLLMVCHFLESQYGKAKNLKRGSGLILAILLISCFSYFPSVPSYVTGPICILFSGAYAVFLLAKNGCLVWIFSTLVIFGYSTTIHDWHIMSAEIEHISWKNLESTKIETAYFFDDIQCLSEHTRQIHVRRQDNTTTYTVSPLASQDHRKDSPISAWLLRDCDIGDLSKGITLIRSKAKIKERRIIDQIQQSKQLKVSENRYSFRKAPSHTDLVFSLWMSRIFSLLILGFLLYHDIVGTDPELE